MNGFIYVLFNDAMPGILKIGQTSKNPFERMRQLSAATSCPEPFKMMAFFECNYYKEIELFVHKELDSMRTNPCREFFKTERIDVLEAISGAFDYFEIQAIKSYTPWPLKLEEI